ncbi:hypothetical protein W03_02810 [Nitrosomonas sp. PY1]|uniref:HvfX family Cu-binding RiPP maturation protein n=1 Tax=Nitrosomonas sp. PY1 TaxID=1803906 RepID=UPI001FC89DEB|nr:DoxX family protein [Nitrosomonas sp. PY1]GKS68277.1 hypothetical protein W03_02810 [Nitrosomonas sp. PY1]
MLSTGYQKITALLNSGTDLFPLLILRLILAYEFWDAGFMKLNSKNWFDQLNFPYPLNLISDDSLWIMSTWLEIVGAIGLLLGLGTRFFTAALMVLTVVAIYTVHWPIEWHTLADLSKGFVITDSGFGNFKLPVMYLAMFMPLLFGGAGRLSIDYVINNYLRRKK